MRRHYVYYRVDDAGLPLAVAAVVALQATLRARHHGLGTELLRRPGSDAAGQVTLMEVYAPVDDAVAASIESAARAALGRWIVGARHVENFVALS